MARYTAKRLHIKKGNIQQDINLYTTTSEVGSNRLCIKDGNITVYAKLVSPNDSQATSLRVSKNNVTYAVAKTAIKTVSENNNTFHMNYEYSGRHTIDSNSTYGFHTSSSKASFSLSGSCLSFKLSGIRITGLSPNTKYRFKLNISKIMIYCTWNHSDSPIEAESFSTSTTGKTNNYGDCCDLTFSFSNKYVSVPKDFTAENKNVTLSYCSYTAEPI